MGTPLTSHDRMTSQLHCFVSGQDVEVEALVLGARVLRGRGRGRGRTFRRRHRRRRRRRFERGVVVDRDLALEHDGPGKAGGKENSLWETKACRYVKKVEG